MGDNNVLFKEIKKINEKMQTHKHGKYMESRK